MIKENCIIQNNVFFRWRVLYGREAAKAFMDESKENESLYFFNYQIV